MRITEIILSSVLLLGLVFRLFDWSGGGVLLTLSIMTFSWYFLALGFAVFNGISIRKMFKKESYSDIKTLHIIGGIFLGFVFSMGGLGTLFKLMFWEGRGIMLTYSLLFVFAFIVIVGVIWVITKSKASFFHHSIIRASILFLIVSSLYSVSDDSLIDLFYKNDPTYAELFKAHLKDPMNKELAERMYRHRDSTYYNQYND